MPERVAPGIWASVKSIGTSPISSGVSYAPMRPASRSVRSGASLAIFDRRWTVVEVLHDRLNNLAVPVLGGLDIAHDIVGSNRELDQYPATLGSDAMIDAGTRTSPPVSSSSRKKTTSVGRTLRPLRAGSSLDTPRTCRRSLPDRRRGLRRRSESIASALTLAETGHLVFSTLHTNDTAQAIDRIISPTTLCV